MVTSSTIQTKPLVRSAQSRVVIAAEIRNMRPPMVGVPFLVTRCDCGPSSRIGWPSRCTFFSQRIIIGPISRVSASENRIAAPVRKVR